MAITPPGSSIVVPAGASLAAAPSTNRLVQTIAPPDAPNQVPTLSMRMGEVKAVNFITGLVDITIGGASGDELVPGVKHLSNYRPVVGDTVWLFRSGNDGIVIDRNDIFGPSAITDAGGSWVTTEETTTSTTMTNLATAGPSISNIPVSPSGNLMVIIGGMMSNDSTFGAAMGYQLTQTLGAPGVTLASYLPALMYACSITKLGAGKVVSYTHCHIRTGLPVGLYTITAKYSAYGGGTGRFANRVLSIIPL